MQFESATIQIFKAHAETPMYHTHNPHHNISYSCCPQLFLVIANILSSFTISLPDGDKGGLGTQTKVSSEERLN